MTELIPADDSSRRLVVAAAVVDDLRAPTRLLAARRTAPPSLAGGWELPGGKVEPGEDPMVALHREIAEELGVRLRTGAVLTGPLTGGLWPLEGPYAMQVWFAQVRTGRVRPLQDHDELRWLRPPNLYAVSWLPADVPIVRALAAHLC